MNHISRIIILAGIASLAFAACKKDDRATVKLSQETQCSKASSVMSRAVDLVSPNYFVNTVNTINSLFDAVVNNDATELMKFKEEIEKSWNSESKKEIDGVAVTIEKMVISLEDVHGTFTLSKDGKWTREDSKNLQIIWNDKDGISCKLSFKANDGRNTALFAKENYNGESGQVQELTYLVVPGTVSVKLTRGNSTLVSGLVTTTSKFRNTECFYEGARVNSAVVLNAEGIELVVTRFKFTSDKVLAKASVYNGTKPVVKAKVEADELVWKAQEDGDMGISDLESCKKFTLDIDILNEMQIKGLIRPDELNAARELADANSNNEDKFKSAVAAMNKAIDVKVYFDGFTKNEQGRIEYLPVLGEDGYWEDQASYKFADNSGYMNADEFFFGESVQRHIQLLLMDLGFSIPS